MDANDWMGKIIDKRINMKKSFIGVLVLWSFSTFSAELICGYSTNHNYGDPVQEAVRNLNEKIKDKNDVSEFTFSRDGNSTVAVCVMSRN